MLFQLKLHSFLPSKQSAREQLNSSIWRTAGLTLINTSDWRAAVPVRLDQWFNFMALYDTVLNTFYDDLFNDIRSITVIKTVTDLLLSLNRFM